MQQEHDVWRFQLSSNPTEIAQAWLQDMAFWEIQEPTATPTQNMGNAQHHDPQHHSKSKEIASNGIGNGHGQHQPQQQQQLQQQQQTLEHHQSLPPADAANAKGLQRRSSTESVGSRSSHRSKQRALENTGVGDEEDEFQQQQQQRLMEYYHETGQVPPQQLMPTAIATPETPPPVWKSAVDPNTGRTYYYDLITRRTQWEKVSLTGCTVSYGITLLSFLTPYFAFCLFSFLQPAELRAWERRKKAEKRQRDAQFFRDMERNILASLARGEMVPGVMDLMKTGPPREPFLASPTNQTNNQSNGSSSGGGGGGRVRTISSMEDAVVLAALRHEGYSDSTGPLSSTTASTQPTSHPTVSSRPHERGQTSTASSSVTSSSSAPTATAPLAGRPPLPTAARRNSFQQSRDHTRQQMEDGDGSGSPLSDSMELSPDIQTPKQPGFYETEGMLAGEHLLDGPITEDVLVLNQAGGLNTMNVNNNKTSNTVPDAKNATSGNTSAPNSNSHFRRNTGGTIHIKSTMSNPNITATIQCVCGVYRAHIVQAWEQEQALQHSPISVMSSSSTKGEGDSLSKMHAANMAIFGDDYGTDLYYNRYTLGVAGTTPPPPQNASELPALSDIIAFYQAFFEKSQMEHDTIIMSLIYVERLIKETNGLLSPTYSNWRSVLFSCMVLASKVWDDLSMWNIDFSNVSAHIPGLSSFTLSRINELEVALLTSLCFNVKVPASEYAKYYFLIRTMLLRSGLLPEEGAAAAKTTAPKNKGPNAVYFNHLEMKTTSYQDSKFPMNPAKVQPPQGHRGGLAAALSITKPDTNRLRAKSMDDYFWVWLQQQKNQQPKEQHANPIPAAASNCMPRRRLGPVLQENVCLEQLVTMKG